MVLVLVQRWEQQEREREQRRQKRELAEVSLGRAWGPQPRVWESQLQAWGPRPQERPQERE
jgi:hypothetical protein